jgi:hypothetical protein
VRHYRTTPGAFSCASLRVGVFIAGCGSYRRAG